MLADEKARPELSFEADVEPSRNLPRHPPRFPLADPAVVLERMWSPDDGHRFSPNVFGWGWSMNFYKLARRLRKVPPR